MPWEPEKPALKPGKPLSHDQSSQSSQHSEHSERWQRAFVSEWCRLAEGRADMAQTCEAANELYLVHGRRDPIEVAREDW